MHKIKLSLVVMSIAAGVLSANPVKAQSYSDITGTNIWNNIAPRLENDTDLDADLVARATRLNQEAAAAYTACNDAIASSEQAALTAPRRFARRPSNQVAAVPTACKQLEAIRTEVESLRSSLAQAASSKANSAFRTW